MNQDVIEHMWKVASNNPNHDTNWHDPVVVTFAHQVARYEREACAELCETLWNKPTNGMATEEKSYGDECASAIRARGQA